LVEAGSRLVYRVWIDTGVEVVNLPSERVVTDPGAIANSALRRRQQRAPGAPGAGNALKSALFTRIQKKTELASMEPTGDGEGIAHKSGMINGPEFREGMRTLASGKRRHAIS
jgi:hypothetical protein